MEVRGLYTALVTPFTDNGHIDTNALRRLVELQIHGGVDGLVPVGTSGESPTLSFEEHAHVIKTVVDAAHGKAPVIAGCGSNATSEAVLLTRRAAELGVQASLQVNPYYNRPNQQGLYRHFMTIADSVDLPMVLYNIPGRSAVSLTTETIVALFQHPNIVSIKDATGDLRQATELIPQLPPKRTVVAGDDSLAFPLIALGGHGLISVTANIVPSIVHGMICEALIGEFANARKAHYRLMPLFRALFLDTNPIPIKYALATVGLIKEVYRLPLYQADAAIRRQVQDALRIVKEHTIS